MPKLGAVLDWRKASAEGGEDGARRLRPRSTRRPRATPTRAARASCRRSIRRRWRTSSRSSRRSTPEEAALARQVAAELSPAELRAWFDELQQCSVPDAVAKIRALHRPAKTEVRRDRPAVQRPALPRLDHRGGRRAGRERGSGDRRDRARSTRPPRASRRGSARCRSATTTASTTTARRSRRASRRSGCASRRPIRTASSARRSTSPSPS